MRHEFVEYAPERLEADVLYVSVEHACAMHSCACGCGAEITTPISPTGWELRFDGQAVSLYPSIGNWELPCRSHYWIWRGRIEWARTWSVDEVARHRRKERLQHTIAVGQAAPLAPDPEPMRSGAQDGDLWDEDAERRERST